MSRNWHYYKVTGKKLESLIADFYERKIEAMNAARRFSRRMGGHRDKIGVGHVWSHASLAVVFKDTPDKNLWKQVDRDSTEYWVPKRNKDAKKLRAEFEALEKAVPTENEIAKAIGFDSFGGNDARYYHVGQYNGVRILSLPDYYKPKTGIGLRRISDITFEKLAGK